MTIMIVIVFVGGCLICTGMILSFFRWYYTEGPGK